MIFTMAFYSLWTNWQKKRRKLFDRQDEIQRKRDGLIDELERQLKQEISISTVLTCEWELQ